MAHNPYIIEYQAFAKSEKEIIRDSKLFAALLVALWIAAVLYRVF